MKFCKAVICVLILITLSCNLKVEIEYPSCYKEIQNAMMEKDFEKSIRLLESGIIAKKQKVDWYYYDYAVALYKSNPMNVRKSLSYLKNAYMFNKNSYEINYYMGIFYLELSEYKKAMEYFFKALD